MTEQEERLVGEALRAYPLEGAEVRFIRHNENITCRVTVGRESYALRIHAPVEGVFLALLEQAPSEELMRGKSGCCCTWRSTPLSRCRGR